MKLCNFRALEYKDKGLGNVSKADREIWKEFLTRQKKLSDAAQKICAQVNVRKYNTKLDNFASTTRFPHTKTGVILPSLYGF